MISIQSFRIGNFKLRNTKEEHPVKIFLEKNKDKAYKVDEIAKATKMNEDTVRSMLGKLVKEKVILHKQPYFAYNNNRK